MSSRKLLESKLAIDNAVYWHHYGDDVMASKPCVIHGYVDKEYDGCLGCKQCAEGK